MFRTKTEARAFCQDVLRTYPKHMPLNEDMFQKIQFLLKGHPDYVEKIGVGIKEIFIGETIFKAHGFYIKRIDDSIIDFSYKSCLNPPTLIQRFASAYRNAIVFDILGFLFKDNILGDALCFKCGIYTENPHVHHAGDYPVSRQIKEFIKENNIQITKEMFDTSELFIEMFNDEEIKNKISDYHNKVSVLQKLCVECHKKEHKRAV